MIREFNISDLDIIMAIWLDENIKAHSFISPQYWYGNFDYVKSVLPNAEIYVYVDGDNVTGFIGLNGSYIEGIFVKSGSQHKGIGTDLLNCAKQKYDELTLSVYSKNMKAVRFYLKNGFEKIDENIDLNTSETEFTMTWRKEK